MKPSESAHCRTKDRVPVERTVQKIDESLAPLSDFAANVEYQARKDAFERLAALGK